MKRLLCPNTSIAPSLTSTDKSSCGESIWQYGEPIDTKEYDLSNLEFICETLPSGKMTDFALSDTGCIVVSEKLKKMLDDQNVKNIEYFPATVIERKGQSPEAEYYAANILGLVDAIDLENSDYRGIKRKDKLAITRIERLVLKDAEEMHSDLYRLNMFRRVIVVEGKLLSFFTDNKISGVRLVDPEKWDGTYGELE